MQALGKHISKLIRSVDLDQTEVSVLDRLMCVVFTEINMLSTLTATDDVVAPFDTGGVVLVYWGPAALMESHIVEESAKVDDLCRRC